MISNIRKGGILMYGTELEKKLDQFENLSKDAFLPLTDIYETDNQFIFQIDMPDVTKENLDITLDQDLLTIHGKIAFKEDGKKLIRQEYDHRNFFRAFKVSHDAIDDQKMDAKIENGVLTIKLSKSEKIKPKKITITI